MEPEKCGGGAGARVSTSPPRRRSQRWGSRDQSLSRGVQCQSPEVVSLAVAWPLDVSQETPLSSEYDFSLANIGRLEAVNGLSRVQLLRPGSLLKFVPEEILIHGRDFRLLRIGFEAGGLEPQAFQVTMAIVQARAQSSQGQKYAGLTLSKAGQSAGSRKPPIPLLEISEDWETERRKQRARGWRVSTVNERFDIATSLPRYFWVPNRTLDSEVRRAFGHFHQGRGPRLTWHHPGGSDLLRCGGFYTASDPNKEDIRAVETMLQAGHSDVVLVDTLDELPSLADVQLAHLRLRALCLPDSSVAEDKWLSALEGTRWLDYVRSCLRKASDISVLVTSRVRSVVLQGEFLGPAHSFPCCFLFPPDWILLRETCKASLSPSNASIRLLLNYPSTLAHPSVLPLPPH
uniref:Myotubularin related protein 11 n=1 Tax=Sus scrofa TaxID=9823 RepID=A0A8D1JB49_PIG